MARLGGESTELLQISPDERSRAGRSAVLFSEEDLTRFLDVMLRTFDQLNYRQEQRFHLELGLLKLVHLQRLLPVEQLLSQLPISSRGPAGGALPGGGSGRAASTVTNAAPVLSSVPSSTTRASTEAKPSVAPTIPFSPFESDRSRKLEDPSAKTEVRAAAPSSERAPSAPRVPTPWEAASQAATAAPMVESTSSVATLEAPPQIGSIGIDLASLRDGICGALESSGHNTAAALLSSGVWTEADGKVRIEVQIKKTMLGLTMNPEAEKIVKSAAREAGYSGAVSVLTAANGSEAANGSQPPPAKRPATAGSLQAEALAHPLVKQALELFNGEVRSVLDLREKQNA
jgi:DNA polymerase-3 subunit gamma/tau